MQFNLPKPYLSYSAWTLWKNNKNEFRARYYEGKPGIETVETVFGKKIARQLEEDESIPGSETRIELEVIPGLMLLSYLDEFDEATLSITEHKTGHRNKDGKVPWDMVKVHKHKQLDWYSMMVKKKYGKVNNKVRLVWHETRFKTKTVEFAGHTLTSDSRELELTGEKKEFIRTITEAERQKIEKDIISAALEISKDYEEYTSRSK